MVSGISLANKCQLLFGFAIVVILGGALSVPWFRTSSLVHETQLEVARQLADAWLDNGVRMSSIENAPSVAGDLKDLVAQKGDEHVRRITLVNIEQVDPDDERNSFIAAALRRFRDDPERDDYMTTTKV